MYIYITCVYASSRVIIGMCYIYMSMYRSSMTVVLICINCYWHTCMLCMDAVSVSVIIILCVYLLGNYISHPISALYIHIHIHM